jgi:hypothetical protein
MSKEGFAWFTAFVFVGAYAVWSSVHDNVEVAPALVVGWGILVIGRMVRLFKVRRDRTSGAGEEDSLERKVLTEAQAGAFRDLLVALPLALLLGVGSPRASLAVVAIVLLALVLIDCACRYFVGVRRAASL